MNEDNASVQNIEEPVIGEPIEETTEEVVEPQEQHVQTPEQNAWYANNRREAEEAQANAQKYEDQVSRMTTALQGLGFESDFDSLIDQINSQSDQKVADEYGYDVELVARHRKEKEQLANENNQLKTELEKQREIAIEQEINSQLSAVQKLRPEVKDVNDIPEIYWKMASVGVPIETAIGVAFEEKPTDIGAIGTELLKSDRFSETELDKLTDDQFSDPDILAKAIKSLEQ